jgi:sugar transferase (PEP-CTERM/EpsH1 system associated)
MTFKVVHLVYSFGCGGLEKVITNLINHSKNYPVEHIVISLTNDTEMMGQLTQDIQLFVLNKKPGNDLRSHIQLYKLLKQLAPQALHTYNFGTIEYHLTAILTCIPVHVHSDHGRGGDDPAGNNRLHNYFRKWVSFFIDHYVVVSDDLYHWVTKKIGVNKQKVSFVFNGVAVPKLTARTSRSCKKFITIGRLDHVKNQTLLIRAFARAKRLDIFSQTELDIVGDGSLALELSSLISELGMTKYIKLLGYRTDIVELLNDADVFVLSSNYEAMPMTILEAISVKTPVICTNVGGISKFVSDQQVLLVEANNEQALADALLELVQPSPQTEQRIKSAYQLLIEQYSVERMVESYLNLYGVEFKSELLND